MRHIVRNDHRHLNKTGNNPVLLPDRLIDHLSQTVLLDSIGIGTAGLQQRTD